MNKVKKIIVSAIFVLAIFAVAVGHILLPDGDLSQAERRHLAQVPKISAKAVFSGDYFSDWEEYLLDQFPGRQEFRTIKAVFQKDVLRRKDNNGLYEAEGHLMKLEPLYQQGQARMAVKKFNSILQAHPELRAAYYTVIPDKNYFLAEKNGYPTMDYDTLLQDAAAIKGQYIDIFPYLSADNYYRTDSHWRQEKILPVAEALAQAMGVTIGGADDYREETRDGFVGVYAGQAALPVKPELLSILQSAVTDDAVVESLEHADMKTVYNWDKFTGMDPYDVYLGGAEALLTVKNPHAAVERHLILFRDSFGSSLAPLLLSGYSQVTLVDLRYIPTATLDQYVDFTDADVLFCYNTTLFNFGASLK